MYSRNRESNFQEYLREEASKIDQESNKDEKSKAFFERNSRILASKMEEAKRKQLAEHVQRQLKQSSIIFSSSDDEINQPFHSSYQSQFVAKSIKKNRNNLMNSQKLRNHNFKFVDLETNNTNSNMYVSTKQEEYPAHQVTDDFNDLQRQQVSSNPNQKTSIHFIDDSNPSFETTNQTHFKGQAMLNSVKVENKTNNKTLQASHLKLGNEPQNFSTTSQEIYSYVQNPANKEIITKTFNRNQKTNIILGDGETDYSTTSKIAMRNFDIVEKKNARHAVKDDSLTKELQKSHIPFFGRNASQFKTISSLTYQKPPEKAYETNPMYDFRKGKLNESEKELKLKVLNAINNNRM
eukprot:TRINITY_DN724_c0_g1_i1.p1 TRINITY_DN724_c0_g1~~TRINITY_DN724_c0_g1_i1.p1  ORF type:complete len:351 (-),score=109.47 TRINITY_DN724_c0_g1_i1:98-1150(-)